MSKASKRERQRENRERRREIEISMQKRSQRLRTLRNIAIVAVPIIVLVVVLQLNNSSGSSSKKAAPKSKAPAMTIDPAKNYTALMKTSEGDITIALDAKQAPKTVNSFVYLAQKNFYNNTLFHRIVTDYVDQGGDPTLTGKRGAGYTLPDEPPATAYKAGAVAMANTGKPHTSGSQFFLTVSDAGAAQLNAAPVKYSVLGQITAGLDVAQKINTFGSADQAGKPTKKISVLSVTISVDGQPLPPPTSAAKAPATTTTKKP